MRIPRTARAVAAAVVTAVTLAACGAGADPGDGADDGPIVIGVLTSVTGPFTPYGVQARAGMRLAAAELNAEGGVDGRTIELVEADDANNVDTGVTEYERMVEQHGALAVGGVISSSVGVAVAEVAEELGTPLLVVKAGSPDVLTAESRSTFRTCLPAAPMTAGPLLQYARDTGVERVGAIVADYAWGQGIRAALEAAFDGTGIELQVETAPVDEDEFTTYLRSLQAFDPQLLVGTGHPPGIGAIAIQADGLGIDVPVVGPYAALASVVEAIGDVAYDGFADFSCVDFASESYVELATRFAEAGEFAFMEADAVAGYGIVRMVAEAVGAGASTPAEVAAYLHDTEFELPGYSHTVSWTAWGELAASRPTLSIVRGTAPPDGVNPGAGWYPEVVSTSDPLEPFLPG